MNRVEGPRSNESPTPRGRGRDDDNRARGVLAHLVADRAENEPPGAAHAARADDTTPAPGRRQGWLRRHRSRPRRARVAWTVRSCRPWRPSRRACLAACSNIGEERRCGVVEGVEHRRAEAVHDGERRLAGSGFSDGPRKGPDQGVRAVDAHDDSSGSVVRTMFLITDHGDGTDSVVQAMPADRPDEQPAEPAQPAAPTTNRSAPADAATRQLPGRSHTTVRPTVTPAGPTARSMSSLSTAAAAARRSRSRRRGPGSRDVGLSYAQAITAVTGDSCSAPSRTAQRRASAAGADSSSPTMMPFMLAIRDRHDCGGRGRHADRRVDHRAAVGADEHRVDVELLDLRDGAASIPMRWTSSTSGSTGSSGRPRKPWNSGARRRLSTARRAADLDDGATSTTLSSRNSASTPPAPTTTSGPNAGSRITPTSSSRPAGCCACTTTPRRRSPNVARTSRYGLGRRRRVADAEPDGAGVGLVKDLGDVGLDDARETRASPAARRTRRRSGRYAHGATGTPAASSSSNESTGSSQVVTSSRAGVDAGEAAGVDERRCVESTGVSSARRRRHRRQPRRPAGRRARRRTRHARVSGTVGSDPVSRVVGADQRERQRRPRRARRRRATSATSSRRRAHRRRRTRRCRRRPRRTAPIGLDDGGQLVRGDARPRGRPGWRSTPRPGASRRPRPAAAPRAPARRGRRRRRRRRRGSAARRRCR